MKVNVDLKGRFKNTFQTNDLQLELPDSVNVRDLLILLCKTTGHSTTIFFNRDMRLKPNVAVTRNGRFIIHLNWLDTTLSDGDKIMIFTLHCGG